MTIRLADLYVTFQGEVNNWGIGAPVIFLRLAGCHLRCYLKTLGGLCDTPEFLEGNTGREIALDELISSLKKLRHEHGINRICLSGGDPLWRKDMKFFLQAITRWGFEISVETSGTLPVIPMDNVSYVIDWKLKSAGIESVEKRTLPNARLLTSYSWIKFVVYDEADFVEMINVIRLLDQNDVTARLAAGVYWKGKIGTLDLFDLLKSHGMLGKVELNVQLHKMAWELEREGPIAVSI